MNCTKVAKLNSQANIFGILVLGSSASKLNQNYENICPAPVLIHIIANKETDIHA